MYKICSTCNLEKDLASFNKKKDSKDGYYPFCKECASLKHKEYRERNKEKIKVKKRKYYEQHKEEIISKSIKWAQDNKDRKKQASIKWDSNNKNLRNKRNKDWRDKDPKKARKIFNKAQKAWRAKNPDKVAALNANRRAQKLKATPKWLTKQHKIQIQEFYTRAHKLTQTLGISHVVDHIYPLKGETSCGLHVPWNLQVITAKENTQKSNKLIEISKLKPKAYQRLIREQKALVEPSPNIDLSSKNASIKEISKKEAEKVILEYEWLKCMPAIVKHCYGLYFGEHLAGAVVYGAEYGENLGVWDKYGFTNKIILLARGACVHWAPKFSGSFLIRNSMKLLPKKYEVITCTTDELAGEIGTIYQACGFYYIGSMRESNPKCKGKKRFGVLINGKLYGSRAIRNKIGSQKKADILKKFPNAQFITQKEKKRYFAFRGSKKIKKQHYETLKHLIKKYPKR